MRTFSSVGQSNRLITGRSRVRVPEGPLFFGLVAQLVRAPPCHGGGHEFESRLGRKRFISYYIMEIIFPARGVLAQLGEHLPYKQRVTGSSPVGPTFFNYAGVAELADAQDLKSCGTNLPYRFDSGRRH